MWLRGLRIQRYQCCGCGYSCDVGLISGKKKKKKALKVTLDLLLCKLRQCLSMLKMLHFILFYFSFFWLHLGHAEIPGPVIEPKPQQ